MRSGIGFRPSSSMASKSVQFHEVATLEFESAVDWYLFRSETAAQRFSEEVERAVGRIAESPHRWTAGKHGTRKFPLQRFPFLIVYRDLPEIVQILAVAHAYRRPEYWKNRLR